MVETLRYCDKPWLEHYDKDVPRTISYPKVTLSEVLDEVAENFPDNVAIISFGKRIKYAELKVYVDNFAAALSDLGVKEGDRVAIHLPNIPQFVIGLFGALKAGAVVVGCSVLYTKPELLYLLNDSGAETIVTLDLLSDIVNSIKNETKLKRVIVTGPMDFSEKEIRVPEDLKDIFQAGGEVPDAYQFLDLMAKRKREPPVIDLKPMKSPAVLQYTGGTTGVPKGTMLTHYNLVSNIIQMAAWVHQEKGKEVSLAGFPFFHLAGLAFCLISVYYAGSQILILDPRDILTTLKLIDEYKPTFIANVPTIYMRLLDHPGIKKCSFNSVKACVSGLAPIPPEIIKQFEEITGSKILEVYGLTETSSVLSSNPMNGTRKPGSVGMPLPDTEVKLIDIETGTEEVPVGEPGELIAQGPQVMKGYWNKPEETERALRNGWLYTGDIATMDKDGYFYIVDRKKDMINVYTDYTYHVYPREVDDVIYEHPAVAITATIGVPDSQHPTSESVKACIVLKPEYRSKTTSDDIKAHCKQRLAPYKVPTIIEFREQLPTTPIGKVSKRVLKKEEKEKLKKEKAFTLQDNP